MINNNINNKLIFDLGFYDGCDTRFYLEKGFNIIAVEANPYLYKDGLIRFEEEIKNGLLTLINKAIIEKSDTNKNIYNKKVKFFINSIRKELSSCVIDIAESDLSKSKCIDISATTLRDLLNEYGVPYYMKVDIEGNDSIVAKELFEEEKPKFVSFETAKKDYFDIFSWLYVSGYRKFQLINQINNSQYSSGSFGKFLPENKWISYDELIMRYIKYRELKQIDNKELGLGWLDVHAMME